MSTSAPEDFAQALAQRLGGQSVRQLAAVSGWGRTTVSDIRAGRHIPSEAQLRDLLMSVGADESEIASWQERRSAIITPPAAPAAPPTLPVTPPAPPVTPPPVPRRRLARAAVAAAGAISLLGIGFAGGYAARDRAGAHAQQVSAAANPGRISGTRSAVVEVSQGANHLCVRTAGGAIECMGRNKVGQLGDGLRVDSAVPVPVGGLLAGAKRISAGGDFACVINFDDQAKCWGHNAYGQAGNGQETMLLTPTLVEDLPDVKEIAVGNLHACALTLAGDAYCWGNGEHGQLGIGRFLRNAARPVLVQGIEAELAGITAGRDFTCAWSTRSEVYCWGAGSYGQLGIGTRQDEPTPVRLEKAYPLGVRAMAAGYDHACAIAPGGGVDCWGRGDSGQLGTGSTEDALTPRPVVGLDAADALTASIRHTCAVTPTGAVACWGDGASGQLGPQSDGSARPVIVPGVSGIRKVSAGQHSSCGISADALWCWGASRYGEIGAGSRENLAQPHRVAIS